LSIHKISIEEFLVLSATLPVFDVRSPGEYHHAHIRNAISLPIFSDEERKIVGTSYKQKGKQPAIKEGLNFFGPKMTPLVLEVERGCNQQYKKIIVHCWRGGMRSGAMAWLLDLYGFDVYLLIGGYKSYRGWALSVFEQPHDIKILGGYTGSAKTEVLQALKENNEPVIDLEQLASHKGSAFGGINQPKQPTQEMFENLLAIEIQQQKNGFWLEDESQRIGRLNIPNALWQNMRKAPIYFIDIPFSERLEHIVKGYGNLEVDKMIEAVERIQKRFGPLETKTTKEHLQQGNIKAAFSLLLKYYDKQYAKSLQNRENIKELLHVVELPSTEINYNAAFLLKVIKANS